MTFIIGQRVDTKFGAGTVVDFERTTFNKVEHCTEYDAGDRIGVQLDTPENWACHSVSSGVPYFLASDF